jgi:L-serine dehydratase
MEEGLERGSRLSGIERRIAMKHLDSFAGLLELARRSGRRLDDVFLDQEAAERELPRDRVLAVFRERWTVMKDSVERGLHGGRSFSGLVGGDARKIMKFTRDGDIAGGRLVGRAMAYSIAVLEENSRMGIIVAAPTAGAAGMVPGTLLALCEERGFDDERAARALVVAGGFGALIAVRAELSGAAGGCQAEQGVGAAMAAGALAFLLGGSPDTSVEAAALTLQNTLGLACDPVAGLVEVPCVVRNGFTAMLALGGAQAALAGVRSVIPMDEVVEAMIKIGEAMPRSLKETADGGLAMTPTGCRIRNELYRIR